MEVLMGVFTIVFMIFKINKSELGAFNSAEGQQCRKKRENFRIISTHFLKSEKLLTLIIKENQSNFGAKIVCNCKLNNYFGAKTSKLQIFSPKIFNCHLRL